MNPTPHATLGVRTDHISLAPFAQMDEPEQTMLNRVLLAAFLGSVTSAAALGGCGSGGDDAGSGAGSRAPTTGGTGNLLFRGKVVANGTAGMAM
ncbi:hypothetical protein ACFL5O_04800, partial [Myxococcota bacterium]